MEIRKAVLGMGALACLVVAGCASGPPLTAEQLAQLETERVEREAARARERAEEEAALERRRADFEARVERHRSVAVNEPRRPLDPSYAVAYCDAAGLDDSTTSMVLPEFIGIAGGGVVCENTAAGQAIIAWREWYCRSPDTPPVQIRDCVVSLWGDGTGPTYGFEVTRNVGIQIDERGYFTAMVSRWQPAAR